MTDPGTPVEPSSESAAPKRRGLGARVAEGRQTFQPGLWLRLVLIGLGLLYLILFVVLNARGVKVSFVVVDTHVSLIWVIVLSGLIGLVVGVLLSQLHRHRTRRRSGGT